MSRIENERKMKMFYWPNFFAEDATEHLTNSWLIFKTFNKQAKEIKSAKK